MWGKVVAAVELDEKLCARYRQLKAYADVKIPNMCKWMCAA